MATSIALLFFFIVLNQSSLLVSASIQATCKTIAANSPNVDYNFCVTSLGADPKSNKANLQELDVIATKLAEANATSTESTITNLLRNTRNNATSKALSDCLSMYDDVVSTLKDTIRAITSKRYFDAKTYLSASLDVGNDCENGFADLKVKSPLTKENNDLRELSTIALVITNLIG